MITDRIGRHEVLLPINHNFNKICDILGSFFNQNTRKLRDLFASSEKKRPFKRARDGAYCPGMTHTILFNCPIKVEIRTVARQSDLRIFVIVMINNKIIL